MTVKRINDLTDLYNPILHEEWNWNLNLTILTLLITSHCLKLKYYTSFCIFFSHYFLKFWKDFWEKNKWVSLLTWYDKQHGHQMKNLTQFANVKLDPLEHQSEIRFSHETSTNRAESNHLIHCRPHRWGNWCKWHARNSVAYWFTFLENTKGWFTTFLASTCYWILSNGIGRHWIHHIQAQP